MTLLDCFINIWLVWLLICIGVVLIRLIKGPSIFDRILCFDAISVCIIGILILLSVKWDSPNFIEVILLYSIFGFFGTIVFSYYLYKAYENNLAPEEKNNE